MISYHIVQKNMIFKLFPKILLSLHSILAKTKFIFSLDFSVKRSVSEYP